MCLSLDSDNGSMLLVVDGQLLGEAAYNREHKPNNLNVLLGQNPSTKTEDTGKIGNFNAFSHALIIERNGGADENCGTPGDFLSWDETEWSLHSKTMMVELDKKWEEPCRQESKVQVFSLGTHWHHQCMEHCQKITGGRSPSMLTEEEWKSFTEEVDLITKDRSDLPYMWLSATEGNSSNQLHTLPHWPELESVNNRTIIDLKAKGPRRKRISLPLKEPRMAVQSLQMPTSLSP